MRIKDRDKDEKQGQDYIWKPVGMRMRIKDRDRDEKQDQDYSWKLD